MSIKIEKTLNQLKALLLCGLVILTTQFINLKGHMNMGNAVLGMLCIIVVALISLKIKEVLPLKIPAFAWASLIALLLTTPISPVKDVLLALIKEISAGQIGTVILALAGVSIGLKLGDIRKLSWKMVIVALVVFCGTFFGSALISELVLKIQGII